MSEVLDLIANKWPQLLMLAPMILVIGNALVGVFVALAPHTSTTWDDEQVPRVKRAWAWVARFLEAASGRNVGRPK